MRAMAFLSSAVFTSTAALFIVNAVWSQTFVSNTQPSNSKGQLIVDTFTAKRLATEQLAADVRQRQHPQSLSPADFVFKDGSVVTANYENGAETIEPAHYRSNSSRPLRQRATYTPPMFISNEPTAAKSNTSSKPEGSNPSKQLSRSSGYDTSTNSESLPAQMENQVALEVEQTQDDIDHLKDGVNSAVRDATKTVQDRSNQNTDKITHDTSGAATGLGESIPLQNPLHDQGNGVQESTTPISTNPHNSTSQFGQSPDMHEYNHEVTSNLDTNRQYRSGLTFPNSGAEKIPQARVQNQTLEAPTVSRENSSVRNSSGLTSRKPPSGNHRRSGLTTSPASPDPRQRSTSTAQTKVGFQTGFAAQVNNANSGFETNNHNLPKHYSPNTPQRTVNRPSAAAPQRNKDGVFLTLLALFASVGLNMYLGWVAWNTYSRYQDLVSDVRYLSPRHSIRTDLSYDKRDLADSGAY